MNEGQNDNIIKDEINEDISDVEENEEKEEQSQDDDIYY